MCGIAGFTGFRDDATLHRMMRVLAHRGPDDSGYHCGERVSLGHQRLSIIDLSERGRQPMENEDGLLKIVFNGEIYNFRELREELVKRGHQFRSDTDTEVILHQYEEDGHECLKKFNGMFAFAIWDKAKGSLFLARDRMGVKPLYYYWKGPIFIFASEMKSILQCTMISRKLNMASVYETLMLRYCRHPNTVIDGIHKLSPAHYLIFDGKTPPAVKCYWSVPAGVVACDKREAKNEFLRLLEDSVEKRLISDVPVGIMLSGGVDSAAICATASTGRSRVHTFSIGFEGQADNEFEAAGIVAKKFNTIHNEITVSPAHITLLPEVIWYNDEPVGGPSSIAYYLAFQGIKQYSTVLLLGHGADEVFAGYEELKIQKLAGLLNVYPLGKVFSGLGKVTSSLFPQDRALQRLSSYLQSLNVPAKNFFHLISVMDQYDLSGLLRNKNGLAVDTAQQIIADMQNAFARRENVLEGIMDFEIHGWLSDDILLRVDRMTMAKSLEGRLPFLDYRIVEFASKLPLHWKLNGLKDKRFLREATCDVLPQVINRRRKQRFNTPIHKFFSHEFDDICRRIFSEENELNETVFDRSALIQLLDFKTTASYRYLLKYNKLAAQFFSRQIWNILVFQLWYKMYFESKSYEELLRY